MQPALLVIGETAVTEEKLSGRRVTLEGLYDEYAREIMGYLRALTRNESLAEDALGETFIRMARKGKSLFGLGNIKAYLFRTARNEAFRIIKKEKRLKAREQDAGQEKPLITAKDDSGAYSEDISALGTALGRLPDEQREIVFLKCVEGFTFEEVSALTGVSRDTAASRYRYGMEKLRTLMGVQS